MPAGDSCYTPREIASERGQDTRPGRRLQVAIDYKNWMRDTLDYAKTLRQIAIPGSHDAGMYMSINCSIAAGSCNTQTQTKRMYDQLAAGMRYFDLRPAWNSGVLYTGHFTSVVALGTEGCEGDTLVNILNEVRDFLLQLISREVVILKFSHYYDRSANKFEFNDNQKRTLIDLVTGILGRWLYVNDTAARLADISLSRIVDPNKANVIAVFEDMPLSLLQPGTYRYGAYLPPPPPPGQKCGTQHGAVEGDLSVYDEYSNTNELAVMEADQLDKLDCAVNHGGDLFLLSWTLTQSAVQAADCLVGIGPTIVELAQPAIDSIVPRLARHRITGANIPNVVYLDVSPTQATDACIEVNQRLGNNKI